MVRAGRYARSDQLDRFRAEAEAEARLRQPHIIQIYEVGEWQGQPYFSMEYVADGRTPGFPGVVAFLDNPNAPP
jgi:eukaryotic-like serine/threonine-protein kinase